MGSLILNNKVDGAGIGEKEVSRNEKAKIFEESEKEDGRLQERY